jgi:hypothetical protein
MGCLTCNRWLRCEAMLFQGKAGQCWAIEVKLSSIPTVDCGFHNAADDVAAAPRILVYKGKERFPMRGGIESMPLLDAMNEVSAAVGA